MGLFVCVFWGWWLREKRNRSFFGGMGKKEGRGFRVTFMFMLAMRLLDSQKDSLDPDRQRERQTYTYRLKTYIGLLACR